MARSRLILWMIFFVVAFSGTSGWACGNDNGQSRGHRFHSIISTSDACEMSSETTESSSGGAAYKSGGLLHFVEIGGDNIASDMARGGGEYLAALATLLNVPASNEADFFAVSQQRYLSLPRADLSPDSFVSALRHLAVQYSH